MDYVFEQQGRRPIVILAALIGFGMTALGLFYGAPWYFVAVTLVSSLMALAIIVQNSRAGMRLEGDSLVLFKDGWSHVIDTGSIRQVRVTQWTDGQPCIWIERDGAPPYRLPGYCFGSATQLTAAFRARGLDVV